jgi:hypothetical protein
VQADVSQNAPAELGNDPFSLTATKALSGSRSTWTQAEVDALLEVWPYRHQEVVSARAVVKFTERTGTLKTYLQMTGKWTDLQAKQRRRGHIVPRDPQDLSSELQEKLVAIFSRYRQEMKLREKQALADQWFAETQVAGSFEELLSLYASLTRPRGG